MMSYALMVLCIPQILTAYIDTSTVAIAYRYQWHWLYWEVLDGTFWRRKNLSSSHLSTYLISSYRLPIFVPAPQTYNDADHTADVQFTILINIGLSRVSFPPWSQHSGWLTLRLGLWYDAWLRERVNIPGNLRFISMEFGISAWERKIPVSPGSCLNVHVENIASLSFRAIIWGSSMQTVSVINRPSV